MMVLVEVVWWTRVSLSDNGGGLFGLTLGSASFRHSGSLGDLGRCDTMSAGSSEGQSEGVLHLASGRTVRVSVSLSEEEVAVFHQLFVVPQT